MTSTATPLAPRTWGLDEPWHTVTVEIKFVSNENSGYTVKRADNGHELGWVMHRSDGWRAFTKNAAYYPADADVMVRSVQHPSHRAETWAHGEIVADGARSRAEATEAILSVLVERSAESLEDVVAAVRAEAGFSPDDVARMIADRRNAEVRS